MNQDAIARWMAAALALQIWNPELWRWHPHVKRAKQLMLYYSCKGIVLHDRALNGEKI